MACLLCSSSLEVIINYIKIHSTCFVFVLNAVKTMVSGLDKAQVALARIMVEKNLKIV